MLRVYAPTRSYSYRSKHASWRVVPYETSYVRIWYSEEFQRARCYRPCVHLANSSRLEKATQKYSYELCGVEGEDRTVLIRAIALVFGLLGLVAFMLRCVARLSAYGTRSWGPDDWVMTLTMVRAPS